MFEKVNSASSSSNARQLDLLQLWWDAHKKKLVRYDPSLLILHHVEGGACVSDFAWGTVFYSKAREEYKARVGIYPEIRATTFDLTLMSQLTLAVAGQLVIAANPNSVVPGHLVVYPREKRADLSFEDIRDMCFLASEQTKWTFIHNMERAAASIVDWAHFQAYPWTFPLVQESGESICSSSTFNLIRLSDAYPAYVLRAECRNQEFLASWLFGMLRVLANSSDTGTPIPCNIVWQASRAWLIPRSPSQTTLAATYIGALEMGGLFCLPSADNLRQYLPEALRREVRNASLADQPEIRQWCERSALELARKVLSDVRNT